MRKSVPAVALKDNSKDQQYWRVLDAVIRLEVTRGHLKWKLTEVSRLSGVGRPLIYYYFGKSKPEIIRTALKVIGDEFFGLSPERLKLWQSGRIAESIQRTRELMTKAPHVMEFYFHWRHQKGEIGDHFRTMERRYRKKLQELMPDYGEPEREALFAGLFGFSLLQDISVESLQIILTRLLPRS